MESSTWGDDTPTGENLGKMRQECKPDYEGMITDLKDKLMHTQSLYHSCENFILYGPPVISKKHLKDLLGHLHIAIKEKEMALNKLMEKAEKEA